MWLKLHQEAWHLSHRYETLGIYFKNWCKPCWAKTVSAYLVHSSEHLCCVGDPLYSPTEDVQGQLQPLQDLTAFTVQTQPLQHLKTHTHTLVNLLSDGDVNAHFRSPGSYCTSSVSLPLVSSSWMFSSARLRACSSACSLCFKVYWSHLKAMAIWPKVVWRTKTVSIFREPVNFRYCWACSVSFFVVRIRTNRKQCVG